MKKNYALFTAIIGALLIGSAAMAQETILQTSTSVAPIWYNMNSAATAAGAINAGLAQATSTGTFGEIIKGTLPAAGSVTDPTQNQDKFLWRFEADGANVYIVNKATGLKISNPLTAVSGLTERFRMNSTGSTFVSASVSGVSVNGVSGTAFYFTPTDAAYSAVGRLNCDGGVAELVLFKGATNGDILPGGGKGSLYWLRLVPMKSVEVSVSSTGASTGTVAILKDDAVTAEAGTSVSKAQSIGVTVVATPNDAKTAFTEWKNKVTGAQVATTASYTYAGTADVQLEAVFSLISSVKQIESTVGVYPNPFTTSLTVENALPASKIQLFDLNGKEVLSAKQATISTAKLQKGAYVLKFTTLEGAKSLRVVKE